MARNTSLSAAAIAALPYWSDIRNAAANHLTTEVLWQSIRDTVERYGVIGSGPTVQGVSQLRGVAGAIVRSADELASLPDSKVIKALSIVRAPWARSPSVQRADPRYQIQFVHTFKVGEQEQSQWRTIMFEGRLPRTVGDLREQVDQDVLSLSDDYDVEHIDASDFQIVSV
jgi:hypothetical protein